MGAASDAAASDAAGDEPRGPGVIGTDVIGPGVIGTDVIGTDVIGTDVIGTDAIAVIELELIKLVRHLETFGRRSSLYVRVDRAGYLVMRMLDELGPVTANALARSLGLDSSTVTRQITALESQGFVERCANPADGRSSTIVLTPQGRQSMREVEAERRRHIEALVSGWEDAGQINLGIALTRLNNALVESVLPR